MSTEEKQLLNLFFAFVKLRSAQTMYRDIAANVAAILAQLPQTLPPRNYVLFE